MKRTILCLMWTAVFGSGLLHGSGKMALVIGNAAYRHQARLANPVNDAAHLANAQLAMMNTRKEK